MKHDRLTFEGAPLNPLIFPLVAAKLRRLSCRLKAIAIHSDYQQTKGS